MKTSRRKASAVRVSTRCIAGTAIIISAVAIPVTAFAAEKEGDADARPVEPAAPAPAPTFYAAAFVATTLVYRPHGASVQGPQGDATPIVGLGYFLTERVALELDVGATFASGGYVATSLTPGVIWAFHPNLYAAGRVIVFVHPEVDLALYPGLGGTYAFGPLAPFLELNVLGTVRGEPDLGLGGSTGALYSF